jgi:hypothetical protein
MTQNSGLKTQHSVPPLAELEVWGCDTSRTVSPVCPLKDDGRCPPGCDVCTTFQREMEGFPVCRGEG